MAKLRELVNRRKAIRNIAKITRTMELIATARFKKALDRATEAAAYTRKIAELAANLASSATNVSHPLLVKRQPVQRTLLLVISSNRGLCGGYNGGIIRAASGRLRDNEAGGQTTTLELSGKRAIAYFRFQRIPAANTYTQFEDKPAFDEVEVIANRYLEMYVGGQVDRIDVCYQKFLNAARQTPVVETLLPLDSVVMETAPAKGAAPAAQQKLVEYEFMPDAEQILQELLPVSFKVRLFKCFLDAAVSEQIARRVAMKAASENANDIIKSLSTQYNRARQAQITKEISEIIGGVEALK
jgi:F-type H+-transporting ATPase subunit gamma